MQEEKKDNYNQLKSLIKHKSEEIESLVLEKKLLQKELDTLKHIIAVVPNHVYWKDKNGIYLGCNDEQAKNLGLSSGKDVIGLSDADLPWAEGADTFKDVDQRVLNTRKVISFEEESRLPNGKEVIFYSTKRPLYDANTADPIGVIGVSVDVTPIKKAENLKFQLDKQEQINCLLETISTSIAHDIKTPLTTVLLGLERLQSIAQKIERGHQCSYCANSNTNEYRLLKETIEKLGKQITNYNAVIAQQLNNIKKGYIAKDNYEIIDVQELIIDIINDYPFKKPISICTDFSQPFKCFADRGLLKGVLLNLMHNAEFFINEQQKGGVFISIHRTDKWGQLKFKDTAKGIKPDQISKIFDRNYSCRKGGSGVGLAQCKYMMEAFGGKIECDSIFGEYTKFTLYFPIAKTG